MSTKFNTLQSEVEDAGIKAKTTAPSFQTRSGLLPTEIDQIAETEPQATFLFVPSDRGYKVITYRQYANAINGMAQWLEEHLGKGDKRQSLAWFGAGGSDIRYAILLVAAVKAGYYMLFNSPRNSVDAHVNLFKLQDCNTLILPETDPPFVPPLISRYPMRILRFPTLDSLFDDQMAYYPYAGTLDENRRDPLVSVHTSGSTGLPKPRVFTLASANMFVNSYMLPGPQDLKSIADLLRNETVLNGMPFFHAAGIVTIIFTAVFRRQLIGLVPSGPPLSADGASDLIRSAPFTTVILPPSILDEIGKRSELLESLTKVKYVLPGGSTVTKAAADAINSKTELLNILGATELGCISQLAIDRKDWAYIAPSPLTGIEFRQHSKEEYEMVMVRKEEYKSQQPTFELFPNLDEYRTQDLYQKHPTKSGLWLYRGRSDDVIVFSNGEKSNPILMEAFISGHPKVSAVLMAGQNRFEASLLIEPAIQLEASAKARAKLIEELWPIIQEANRQQPAYARISKTHVLFTAPEKPMLRAGKGTVQRRLTIESYTPELDALYADAETMNDSDCPVMIDESDLEASVLQLLQQMTGFATLKSQDDFFACGMDSLQVIQTARYLNAGLQKTNLKNAKIAPSTIYTRPTVSELTIAIKYLGSRSCDDLGAGEMAREKQMSDILQQYSSSLKSRQKNHGTECERPPAVILTGSTGSLGCYLLNRLNRSPSVSKIYCLNRSCNSLERQTAQSASQGLSTNWDPQRVVFLTIDLSSEKLGLTTSIYDELAAHVNLIIHNAWQVDFNLPLSSYEKSHIRGVCNLVNLSAQSPHHCQFLFVSSIGAVDNWRVTHRGAVPEEVIADLNVAGKMGYAESKLISEQLVDLAATKCDVDASICRIGQIAGPANGENGIWNPREWFPSLVISSLHLRALPDLLGSLEEIDWVPIDFVATIVAELALAQPERSKRETDVYHIVNPERTTWKDLLPFIQNQLGDDIQVISLAAWVQKLRASAETSVSGTALAKNPAIKLLDFYQGLVDTTATPTRLETRETKKRSTTLRELKAVKKEWLAKWISRWI